MHRMIALVLTSWTIPACDGGDTTPAPVSAKGEPSATPVGGAGAFAGDAKADADDAKPGATEDSKASATKVADAPSAPADAPAMAAKPTPGPLRFEPATGPGGPLPHAARADDPDEEARSSAWDFGWTKDGKAFASCNYDASDEGGECTVQSTNGKVTDRFAPGAWADYVKKQGPIERGKTTWPYGDIVLTSTRKGPELKVGGRVASEASGGVPDLVTATFDPDNFFEDEGEVGIGFASVSPDGTRMAIAAVAVLGEIDQQLQIEMLETSELAARVYSAHGFRARETGNHERAAQFFARAAEVSDAWKHPYNEACARATGRLEGIETALATAIARGGAQAKAKAKRDPDLASVRSEAWFATLVAK